jgi:hypothetical protein
MKTSEEETQALNSQYRPHIASVTPQFSSWTVKKEKNCRTVRRCLEFKSLSFGSATLSEKQGCELLPMIEQEHQTERPVLPSMHQTHHDVGSFIRRGTSVSPRSQ